MSLCVQTNKYSKLHKWPGLEHVESIFKESQVAPKEIKKLISLPKETLYSNVETHTWKSFSLQRDKFLQRQRGVGRILHGAAASAANCTVLSLEWLLTFPAKENLSVLTVHLWAKWGKGARIRLGTKGFSLFFFFFFLNLHMTHWKKFINVPWKRQKHLIFLSVETNIWRVNSSLSGSLASFSQKRDVFLLFNSLRKAALYFLAIILVFHLQIYVLVCRSMVT